MKPIPLSKIERWIDENDIRCLTCGSRLSSADLKHYPHPGGIDTDHGRLWIYFECPRCGYQNALHKLVAKWLIKKWKLKEA